MNSASTIALRKRNELWFLGQKSTRNRIRHAGSVLVVPVKDPKVTCSKRAANSEWASLPSPRKCSSPDLCSTISGGALGRKNESWFERFVSSCNVKMRLGPSDVSLLGRF